MRGVSWGFWHPERLILEVVETSVSRQMKALFKCFHALKFNTKDHA